ncbi:dihydrolipoamide acetyltransferase family protein [Arthrobacter silvisoli]|uniref:dihydrolipoamide acetyltransferase family protein n=1 Tax=Arthrobacter silvisoli TaxID=2291022 RepID=UPI000E20CE62|nr:dihydrolipoamide acetyltransferase family protein [Arthrobacter silvisoli]
MSPAMIKEFRLPDLGEGLTESEILSWKVAVGDTVELNQVIAEVETAKAVVELPSPFAGTVAALHEQPGSVVEVGKPIVSFEVDDVAAAPSGVGEPAVDAGNAAGAPAAPPAPVREATLVGYGAAVEQGGHPTRRQRTFAPAARPAVPATASAPAAVEQSAPSAVLQFERQPGRQAERPRSTPPVRKLARDLGVDLTQLSGSGAGGLITREDVQHFAEDAAAPASARPRTGSGRETRTPIKGVRKYTAAAVVQSAFTAPHVTEFLTVDVTAAMELLERLKASRTFQGYKLTPLTLAAKAVLIALKRNPTLNSRWDEAAQEIVEYNYVNLGIAAATPRGLTVPNIKDADAMGLLELSAALSELTEAARAGKTTPADLAGGTISITNIGVFGIDAGTPILNPGEAAILSLGAVRKAPWVHNDELAVRHVMSLSLSFDHRLVDGEQGSRFLADVGAVLSDPGMVLAMV